MSWAQIGHPRPPRSSRQPPENDSRNSFVVVVEPKQTLRQISLRYLGRFDSKLVEEIRQLNPGITDPNQIEIGQRIRLPLRSRTSGGRSLAAEVGAESQTSPAKKP